MPHLFSVTKLSPLPAGFTQPVAENPDAATRDLRRWVSEMSDRVGRRADMLREVQRAGWDPRALAELVQRDPLLSGAVLKIINSGFYGLRQRAASVLQAVLLLGVVEVRNLIYRACMSESLGLDRHPARSVIDEVWTHSFATSRMAYAMARRAGHPRADEISTAALLHDVGKIVFLVAESDRARGLYDGTPYSDLTRLRHEVAEFGVTHARISATLAEAWGLPGKTITTIAQHHAPSYVEAKKLEGSIAELAFVHTADLLSHIDPRGRVDDDSPPLPRPGWLSALDLGLDRGEASNDLETKAMTRSHGASAAPGSRHVA